MSLQMPQDTAFVRHFAAYILQWFRCGSVEGLIGAVGELQ
jgi:hypothetical protein